MRKIVLILSCIFLVSAFMNVEAKTKRYKKNKHSKSYAKSKRKKHRRHGNGPDLKEITKNSTYTENPNNGINPIENNKAY